MMQCAYCIKAYAIKTYDKMAMAVVIINVYIYKIIYAYIKIIVNLKILANTTFGHIIKVVLVRKIEASLYLGHTGFNTDEWVKKMWHIYTMEYYSIIRRNEIQSVVIL